MTAYKSPCPHGRYEPHTVWVKAVPTVEYCPGGSLLPPDSLVIVKEDGEWPLETVKRTKAALIQLTQNVTEPDWTRRTPDFMDVVFTMDACSILDALAAAQRGGE